MTTTTASHACWSYTDHTALDEYAKQFLNAGLAAGERVWYVPGPRSGTIADWLQSLTPMSPGPDPIKVISWRDAYTAG